MCIRDRHNVCYFVLSDTDLSMALLHRFLCTKYAILLPSSLFFLQSSIAQYCGDCLILRLLGGYFQEKSFTALVKRLDVGMTLHFILIQTT